MPPKITTEYHCKNWRCGTFLQFICSPLLPPNNVVAQDGRYLLAQHGNYVLIAQNMTLPQHCLRGVRAFWFWQFHAMLEVSKPQSESAAMTYLGALMWLGFCMPCPRAKHACFSIPHSEIAHFPDV